MRISYEKIIFYLFYLNSHKIHSTLNATLPSNDFFSNSYRLFELNDKGIVLLLKEYRVLSSDFCWSKQIRDLGINMHAHKEKIFRTHQVSSL